MTELHEMLREQADRAGRPHVDPDAIMNAGRRRVRHRRALTGLAAAGVAGVVAAGTLAMPTLFPTDRPLAPAAQPESPFTERRVGYATGSTIHWGDQSFEPGDPVVSYVQTDDGFVLTNPEGDVWFFDGARTRQLGSSVDGTLRSDDTGSLVAWVEPVGSGEAEYVVADTAAGAEVSREAAPPPAGDGELDGPALYAVDGRSAYWRAEDGIVRFDVDTGTTESLPPARDSRDYPSEMLPRKVLDVAEGVLAYIVTAGDDEGEREALYVGKRVGAEAVRMEMGWYGVLSPDGRLIGVEDADRLAVYDTRTGEDRTPKGLKDYPFAVVYGWVDADTAMALAIEDLESDTYAVDLLACDIDGACTTVAQVDVGASAGEDLVLPVGDPMS